MISCHHPYNGPRNGRIGIMIYPAFHNTCHEKFPSIHIPIVTLVQNTSVCIVTNPTMSDTHFRQPSCPSRLRSVSIHQPCGRPTKPFIGIAAMRDSNDCFQVNPTNPTSMIAPIIILKLIIASTSATSFVVFVVVFMIFWFLLWIDFTILLYVINLYTQKSVVQNYNRCIK